jgi:nucleoid-associated protein Lsr2
MMLGTPQWLVTAHCSTAPASPGREGGCSVRAVDLANDYELVTGCSVTATNASTTQRIILLTYCGKNLKPVDPACPERLVWSKPTPSIHIYQGDREIRRYQLAQQTIVQLVDDLDGTHSSDVATVHFGLDGAEYEIDLNVENAESLREALAAYVESGRRTGGRIKRGARTNGSRQDSDAGIIRTWANGNGYKLSSRGRIPAHVIAAYEEAQEAPAKPTATRARRRTSKK